VRLTLVLRTAAGIALAAFFSGLTIAHADNLAFTHATIINPANASIIRDGVLVIAGDRITAVDPPNDTKIPDGARTMDCTGKFILPGYIDKVRPSLPAISPISLS
jgi:adenine deaminase